jgi:hypothetical protein
VSPGVEVGTADSVAKSITVLYFAWDFSGQGFAIP